MHGAEAVFNRNAVGVRCTQDRLGQLHGAEAAGSAWSRATRRARN